MTDDRADRTNAHAGSLPDAASLALPEHVRRRIEELFGPGPAADEVASRVADASDREPIQAAIVGLSEGDLTKLDQAIELAHTDWRDLLVGRRLPGRHAEPDRPRGH